MDVSEFFYHSVWPHGGPFSDTNGEIVVFDDLSTLTLTVALTSLPKIMKECKDLVKHVKMETLA